jgi:hypothetical protein
MLTAYLKGSRVVIRVPEQSRVRIELRFRRGIRSLTGVFEMLMLIRDESLPRGSRLEIVEFPEISISFRFMICSIRV